LVADVISSVETIKKGCPIGQPFFMATGRQWASPPNPRIFL